MAPSSKSLIQAVVFDLDDTLYGERDYVRSGFGAAAEHLRRLARLTGSRMSDRVKRLVLSPVKPFEEYMWSLFQAGRTEKVFNATSAHFELNLTDQQIAELVEVYRRHSPAIVAFSGMPDLLCRLKEHYRLGLLSDGFLPAQRLKLEALKLERLFDCVLFTEELGRECWKPSPVGFQAIAERLGAPGEACAYVADNPAKDFVAPNALGWRTIQYLRPGQLHATKPAPPDGQPHAKVRAADELLAALR